MRGKQFIIQLVFHSASLELLLVAISQNGLCLHGLLPGGGLLLRTEAVALFALPVKPGKFNFPFLPGRDSLRVLEVVRGYQVCREVKHRPLQSHGPLLSPDVFGDGVKGAEGGNPDYLESRGFPYTYFSDIILTVHIPACRGILHSFGQTIRPADINQSIIEWFSLVLLDTSV